MQRTSPVLFLACMAAGVLAPGSPALHFAFAQEAAEADREYVLEAHILGYQGVGGDVDGVRNPVLRAKRGETVRIVLVNREALVHDLALETMNIKSKEILDVGERTDIVFTAVEDDIYYCTIPGHRAAGMEGRFELIREPGQGESDADPASENEATEPPRAPLLSELPPLEEIVLPPLERSPHADTAESDGQSGSDWADFLDDPDEHIRAHAVRQLANHGQIPEYILPVLARMAREDSSLLVRTYLADAARRIEPEHRWDVLEGLHGQAADPADTLNAPDPTDPADPPAPALPLLVWYATEGAVPADMDRALTLALDSKWPHAVSFTVQRIAAAGSQDALRTLTGRLPQATPEHRTILLNGIRQIVQPTDP